MSEIDPTVERRLRELRDHIERTPVPAHLGARRMGRPARRRGALALAATVIAAAALSVGLVFAALSNHRAAAPQPTAPAASAPAPTGTPSTAPSAAPSPSASVDPAVVAGPVPPGFAAASVTFVSTQAGWVLGTVPCAAANPCLTLLRTDDGGRSWVRVLTPAVAFVSSPGASAGSGVRQVRFASAADGWLFGPALWATHDGGAHWARVSLPGLSAAGIVVRLEASAGMVQAVADDPGNGVVIESARAGGDAWQRSPVQVAIGAGPVPETELVLQGGEGWLIQNDRTVVGGARYHNGTWTSWTPPCRNSGGSAALAASSALDLIAVCDEGLWSGGPPVVHAYTSHDGGLSFSRAAGSLSAGVGGAIASARSGQAVIADSSPAGSGPALVLTTDGGASATVVYRGAAGGAGLSLVDLGFTSSTQGVAVEGSGSAQTGSLLMTHDGGAHWAPVSFTSAAP